MTYRLLGAGRDCVEAFKSLLELVKQIAVKPTPENKAKLPAYSKEVAAAVGEVVHAAEKMKSECGWVWPTFRPIHVVSR